MTTKPPQSYPLLLKQQLRRLILRVRSGGLLSQRQVALLPLLLLLLLLMSPRLTILDSVLLGSILLGSILLVRPQIKALLFIDVTIFLAVLISISLFIVIKYLTPQLLQKKLPLVVDVLSAIAVISLSKSSSISLSARYWWTRLLNPSLTLLLSSLVYLVN